MISYIFTLNLDNYMQITVKYDILMKHFQINYTVYSYYILYIFGTYAIS